MEVLRIRKNNTEVAITEGVMIGRSKGPIQMVINNPNCKEVTPITEEKKPVLEVVKEEENFDTQDYIAFCKWMKSLGGEPTPQEYKLAIAYYSNNK